jgi:uncharacterized OB-fold protein
MEHIGKDELVGLSCRNCDALVVPPKMVCPFCGGADLNRVRLSGKGSIYSYTVIHVASPRFADDVPYTVAVVELDEGPRITGRLLGVDEPESGLRVRLTHVGLDDERVMIAFRPLAEG